MRTKNSLLYIDAAINLALGVLLVSFPDPVVKLLGVPSADSSFYPSILGAVLFGIGVALLIERRRGGGLGLSGAIAINLSGGVVLACWLLFGDMAIPLRGYSLLWGLVLVLLGVSAMEILAQYRHRGKG